MRSVAEDEFLIGHNETLTLLRWWSLNSVSRDRILPKHDAANHVLAVQRAGDVLPRTFKVCQSVLTYHRKARRRKRRRSFWRVDAGNRAPESISVSSAPLSFHPRRLSKSSGMTTLNSSETSIGSFVVRWQASGAAERANYQLFLSELCEVLDLPRPEPTKPKVEDNAYVFERDVTFQNLDGTTSIGRIDLYKRGCFVLEAKQGSQQPVEEEFELTAKPAKLKKGTAVRGTKGWDDAMLKARGQAEQYARALPTDEGWPPFLIVVDVGHTIELFADFTRAGKTYLPILFGT